MCPFGTGTELCRTAPTSCKVNLAFPILRRARGTALVVSGPVLASYRRGGAAAAGYQPVAAARPGLDTREYPPRPVLPLGTPARLRLSLC